MSTDRAVDTKMTESRGEELDSDDELLSGPPRNRRRRGRTHFTERDIEQLEAAFREDRYPDIYQRQLLADQLGVQEDRIQVWFQNRRSKLRKMMLRNSRGVRQPQETVGISHIARQLQRKGTQPSLAMTSPYVTMPPYMSPTSQFNHRFQPVWHHHNPSATSTANAELPHFAESQTPNNTTRAQPWVSCGTQLRSQAPECSLIDGVMRQTFKTVAIDDNDRKIPDSGGKPISSEEVSSTDPKEDVTPPRPVPAAGAEGAPPSDFVPCRPWEKETDNKPSSAVNGLHAFRRHVQTGVSAFSPAPTLGTPRTSLVEHAQRYCHLQHGNFSQSASPYFVCAPFSRPSERELFLQTPHYFGNWFSAYGHGVTPMTSTSAYVSSNAMVISPLK